MDLSAAAASELAANSARRKPEACGVGSFGTAIIMVSLLLINVLCIPKSLRAQARDDWGGDRVVQKTEKLELFSVLEHVPPVGAIFPFAIDRFFPPGDGKDAKKTTKSTCAPMIYWADEPHGAWVWISSDDKSVAGWVRLDGVISVDKAIEFFTDRIRSNPKESFSLAMRGMLHADEKQYDAAVRDYDEVIRLDPKWPQAYKLRGIARHRSDCFDKALDDFDKAIELDPKDARAYVHRGDTWWATTQTECAIADYAEAIRLDPADDDAYFSRAFASPFPANIRSRWQISMRRFAAIQTRLSISIAGVSPCWKRRTKTRRSPISTW